MSSVEEKLSKLREERIAREKARIEKLKKLNLQKYSKNEVQNRDKCPVANKFSNLKPKSVLPNYNVANSVKKNVSVNGTNKRPISYPLPIKKPTTGALCKSLTASNKQSNLSDAPGNGVKNTTLVERKQPFKFKKPETNVVKNITNTKQKGNINERVDKTRNEETAEPSSKTLAPGPSKSGVALKSAAAEPKDNRKSFQPPKQAQSALKADPKRVSVFERLYKPKIIPKVTVDEAHKLKTDPSYLKKVIRQSQMIIGKRHTISHSSSSSAPVRRSISAVHLKKASKSELGNCIHSWASIDEKLNKVKMHEVDEDESVECEKVVSAVKSERKRVKFQTPVSMKFNTPSHEELQTRLQNWLQKRGKSLDLYHHLQCFGIAHLSNDIRPHAQLFDEENKENIALESDSDDRSYTDNLNDRKEDFEIKDQNANDKWRRASYVSDNISLNESKDTTLTSADDYNHVDELLLGAMNDLTELLREGFDWGQCARWLRAIRDRFPSVPESSAYWECRAALEERRGDLPASMECWEEAIAKGTERSVVEANLDQLLDKFMQLKLSPSSGRREQVESKMVDVKNVLKSTIIRFAVHKAKLRQSNSNEPPKYTVTPVRRSVRLSTHGSAKRTPLQVCTTFSQATSLGHPVVFVPNNQLFNTP